ncbi:MAG: hypothetical protein HY822_01960 [Acidobacteria bacterium]|nr:hypothetical protein [Acidobacteriota bacterium]
MRRARGRDGFALLLVFAMAAAVAILLYTEMPRVVFEAQRMREQTLIDRGEQYQRAIQLFVRKNQRYPARIEDLENTNNIRFLRRRYPDPMTGKDEWRLVHVGPGGMFLDSLVHKPPSPDKEKDKEKKPENTFITQAAPVGSTAVGYPGQPGMDTQSPAASRRASDRAPVSSASMAGMTGVGLPPADPNAPPPPPGQSTPFLPVPPGAQPGQYPGSPMQGQMVPYGQPGYQVAQYPGAPANSQTGGQVPIPYPTYQMQTPGQQPIPAPAPGAANPNPALELIRNLLTSPRQGGPIGGMAQSGAMQLGGGIAGVASKRESEGIKVYNERTAYNEWEFIYDPKNDKALGGGTAMGAGPIQSLPGQQPVIQPPSLGARPGR